MRGRSYTAKVVDRDVGRPCAARGISTMEPLLVASAVATARGLLLLLPVLSFSPGPAYLFLSLSLPPFLLRLLLYFCPFARFLLPQTTAAYLYPVFASRGSERGRFCVYSPLPFPGCFCVAPPIHTSFLYPFACSLCRRDIAFSLSIACLSPSTEDRPVVR